MQFASKKARKNQENQCQMHGHDVREKPREFQVGDLVYARNYGQGPTWLPGKVTGIQGAVLYTILLEDGRSMLIS